MRTNINLYLNPPSAPRISSVLGARTGPLHAIRIEESLFPVKQFKFQVAPFDVGGPHVHVSVRFFTTLREVTGKKEEVLEFSRGEAVTVESVLRHLVELHGKSLAQYVYDPKTGEVRGFLQFLVNGRSITSFGGLKTKLSNGDVLAIIPPVGGG